MAHETLLDKLREPRKGYGDELVWHRFLLDAYTGTGGFGGKVQQPAQSYLGWAADAYSNSVVAQASHADVTTYLDRYPREDTDKFKRRLDVAYYINYVEAVLDLLVSYILKRDLLRENVPDALLEWMQDIDGEGNSWDKLSDEVSKPRAAALGWFPMMFDLPAAPEGETLGDQQQAGQATQPTAIPLFPANLLDWQLGPDGKFEWVKVRIDSTRREGPLSGAVMVQRYLIWMPTTVRVIEFEGEDDNSLKLVEDSERPHPFGAVPVVSWRHKPCPEDRVRGIGMVDGIAIMARRLFNLLSELDEHLRQQVFALLQVPIFYDDDGNAQMPDELVAGTDNALPVPHNATQGYDYLAPPASISATYETRIASTVQEMYRLARVDHDRADTSQAAQSGLSRAYVFEKTNRRLGDFAKQIAASDLASLTLVGRGLGISDDVLDEMTVSAPTDFRVEDVATEIDNALKAMEAQLPPEVAQILRRRLVGKLLPNLTTEDQKVVDDAMDREPEPVTPPSVPPPSPPKSEPEEDPES